MKAVLLCAGEGTRLRPLTNARPKHLLPVGGRPVLDHVLASLAEAGIGEAVFVVSPDAPELREYIADGSRWGMSADFVIQESPRGLADAVRCAEDQVLGERFIVYLGDDLLGDGVTDFVGEFMSSGASASLIVKPVEDPRQFGVVVVEGGKVTRLVEKPADPPSDLAIVGVYGFGPEIFDAIGRIKPSARGELEITDAIHDLLVSGGRVDYHVTEGFWADAGSLEALLRANEYYIQREGQQIDGDVTGCVIDGAVLVRPGAVVRDSQLQGPCLVCAGSTVTGSQLGPNVTVGAGCTVTDSVVRSSILDAGCRIDALAGGLVDSVLGQQVCVNVTGDDPHTCLLAEDNTTIADTPG